MGSHDFRRVKGRKYTHACPSGKRRFPKRDGAFYEYQRLELKFAAQGLDPPRDIYRCHLCFGWHVTTKGLSDAAT